MTAAIKEAVRLKSIFSKQSLSDWWLCRTWLTLGLFIQLTGFFWLPDTHLYKVNTANLLLLPALISLLNKNVWRTILESRLLQTIFIYLIYMSAIPAFLQNQDAWECAHRSLYIAIYILAISQRLNINATELRHLLFFSVVICAIAITYTITNDILLQHQWSDTYRLTGYGALYNPLRSGHLFGFFCLTAWWLTLSIESSSTQRSITFTLTIICLSGIVLTGSRAPLFGLAIGGFYLIYFATPPKLFKKTLLISTLVFLGFSSIFWQQLTARGLSLRPQIWSEVIKQWQEHPWFGVGYNAGLTINISTAEDTIVDTHNIVLAALYYGGIIGAILFCTMHAAAFFQAFRMQKSAPEAILASSLMIYGMTTLQFDGGSIIGRPNEFWLLLWFPIALLLFIQRHSATTNKSIL